LFLLCRIISVPGRYCCKSCFARGVQNSEGRRRVFRVEICGTSLPHAKLIGDFRSTTEVMRIVDRFPFWDLPKNLDQCNFRLLQQYLPQADSFDHLIGSHKQGWRHREPKRPSLTASQILARHTHCGCDGTTWASSESGGECDHQSSAHRCDRVRDVAFGSQRRSLGVGNCWERQVP
jgi:hypothetical protein